MCDYRESCREVTLRRWRNLDMEAPGLYAKVVDGLLVLLGMGIPDKSVFRMTPLAEVWKWFGGWMGGT